MNTRFVAGFTIIETMLFLAITGVLAVGILASSSLMIATQRYKDSVTSFQAELQQQYERTFNVVNGRGNDFKCNSDTSVTETNPSPGQPRGQSECVIIGRYIKVDHGENITTANLIGYATDLPTGVVSDNDLEDLQRYTISAPNVAANDATTTQLNWGATLYNAVDNTSVSFTMLIMRSPLSGTVRTFIYNGDDNPTPLKDMVTEANQVEKKVCLNPGSVIASARMAVVIRQYAASASGIETLGEGNGC